MIENNLFLEIHEQPEALRRIFKAYIARDNVELQDAASLIRNSKNVIFSGMATSEYASYGPSSLLNERGINNFVYDASELIHYHLPTLYQPGTCLVLVSQSGNSAEIVRLIEEIKGKVPVIGIFNDKTSYLASNCDIGLPIYAGPQLACGSKTNLSTIAVLLILAEAVLQGDLQVAGDRLLAVSDSIERFLKDWKATVEQAVEFLRDAPYTVILGRGPGRASAMFSAVLFREVPKVVAEGMGAALFRHGLMEMIRPEHRVVIFAPDGATYELLINLARELLEANIPVLIVTNRPLRLSTQRQPVVIELEPHPELWAPLLDMVPLQLVGYRLAEVQGLEPGRLMISSYITTEE